MLCLLIASAFAGHPDYCQDKYNCAGEKHVGCEQSKLWDGVREDKNSTRTNQISLKIIK